jgi:hypothetical protein
VQDTLRVSVGHVFETCPVNKTRSVHMCPHVSCPTRRIRDTEGGLDVSCYFHSKRLVGACVPSRLTQSTICRATQSPKEIGIVEFGQFQPSDAMKIQNLVLGSVLRFRRGSPLDLGTDECHV